MRRYCTTSLLLLLLFLTIFLGVEWLNPTFLSTSNLLPTTPGLSAGLLSSGLLTADILLPIPSSLIMIANGALFGIVLGTGVSLVGNLGAAVTGFFLGRQGSPLLARFLSLEERERAQWLLTKWGLLAIIITRPIPLLAETVVVMAGASKMSWLQVVIATLGGSLPMAILYALTGATAASFDSVVLTFGLTLVVAGVFWGVGWWFSRGDANTIVNPSQNVRNELANLCHLEE